MPHTSIPVYSIYNLPGKPLSAKDILADGLAHYLNARKDLHFPHKHSFYQIVFFTKGGGTHSIDFVQFDVKPGQVYFMVPGQVHTWEFEGKMDGYIVNFSAEYLHALITNTRYLDQFSFFSGIASEQVINIAAAARPPLISIFETIVTEFNSDKLAKDDIIRTSLLQLLIHIERVSGADTTSRSSSYNSLLLKNFQQLIEQHFKEKKLTRDYAALLYLTPNHLNALCKDLLGKPAGELIRDRVLLEAKRLLINQRMSIAEIAAELDFADNSYFTKFFKKYEGTTPQVFRQKHIKE